MVPSRRDLCQEFKGYFRDLPYETVPVQSARKLWKKAQELQHKGLFV
jgi:hypothetical protein